MGSLRGSDNASFTLAPGQGIEIKLVMQKDAQANFAWMSEGGPVNFDLHGDGPGGNKISYEKGRGVDAKRGTLVAAFDGNQGGSGETAATAVTLTLQTRGYTARSRDCPDRSERGLHPAIAVRLTAGQPQSRTGADVACSSPSPLLANPRR